MELYLLKSKSHSLLAGRHGPLESRLPVLRVIGLCGAVVSFLIKTSLACETRPSRKRVRLSGWENLWCSAGRRVLSEDLAEYGSGASALGDVHR